MEHLQALYSQATDEIAALRAELDQQQGLKMGFEGKQKKLINQINALKAELEGIKENNEDLKSRLITYSEVLIIICIEQVTSQEVSLINLNKDKLNFEKQILKYQADSASLKEEILSKSAIITQRDAKVKQAYYELADVKEEIAALNKVISEKGKGLAINI